MSDILGKVFVAFMAAYIMFIFPVMLIATKQDDLKQTYIDSAVTEFVDNARGAGKITPEAFDTLCRKIDNAHLYCDIQITHSSKYTAPRVCLQSGTEEIPNYPGHYFNEGDYIGTIALDSSGNPIIDGGNYKYVDYEYESHRVDFTRKEITDYMRPEGVNIEDRDYILKNGDFLTVTVQNVTPTLGARMTGFFFGKLDQKTLFTSYGGYVGNTAQ